MGFQKDMKIRIPQIPAPLKSLKNLLDLYMEAYNQGFELFESSSLESSPVDILFETVIDLLLLIKKQFALGSRGSINNPSLIFSRRYSDALGNPKQIRITKESKMFWDPHAKETLLAMVSFFVRCKRGDSFEDSFMESFKDLKFAKPPAFVRLALDRERDKLYIRDTSERKKVVSRASYHWRRREQRRSKKR